MSKQTKRNQSFENENNKKIIKKDQNLLLIYQNHFQIQQIFLNKTRPLTVIIKRKSLRSALRISKVLLILKSLIQMKDVHLSLN